MYATTQTASAERSFTTAPPRARPHSLVVEFGQLDMAHPAADMSSIAAVCAAFFAMPCHAASCQAEPASLSPRCVHHHLSLLSCQIIDTTLLVTVHSEPHHHLFWAAVVPLALPLGIPVNCC